MTVAVPPAPVSAAQDVPATAPAADDAFQWRPGQTVVFFGDSITATGEYVRAVERVVAARFTDRRLRLLPRGRHGDNARSAMDRVAADLTPLRPDWVVVNFGMNDRRQYGADDFVRHYAALLDAAAVAAGPQARLAIASPSAPDTPGEDPRLREMVAALRPLAAARGLTYVPVYEATRDLRPHLPADVRYAPDTVHPNAIGAAAIAQAILAGFDFPVRDAAALELDVPARRTNKEKRGATAGRRFELPLPMPVRVTLTDPPPPVARAAPTSGRIAIDGDNDDWGELRGPIEIGGAGHRVWGTTHPGGGRSASARAWFRYDADAVYVLFGVEDGDVRAPAEPVDVVSRDCVEFCLDLRPADERRRAPSVTLGRDRRHVVQYVVAPRAGGGADLVVGNGDPAMATGVTAAASAHDRGYVIELRVPAALLPEGRIDPGREVGLDVTVVDVTAADERYRAAVATRWTGSAWSAFDTREYGTLRFAAVDAKAGER